MRAVYTNSILATYVARSKIHYFDFYWPRAVASLNSRRSIRGAGRDLDTIEAGGAAFRGRGISGGTVNVAMANLTFVKGDDNPTSSSRTPVALKDYKKVCIWYELWSSSFSWSNCGRGRGRGDLGFKSFFADICFCSPNRSVISGSEVLRKKISSFPCKEAWKDWKGGFEPKELW